MPEKSSVLSVLCVDCDAESAGRIAQLLEGSEAELSVRTVTDEREAFDSLAEEPVDCIVSAHSLGEIDGIQFLEAVRAEYPDLPFILYAATGSEQIASDAFAANASDYIAADLVGNCEELAVRIRASVERERTADDGRPRNDRAKRVLDAAPDAIVVTVDGELVYSNRAAADLFGVADRNQLLGSSLSSFTDIDPAVWEYDRLVSTDRELTRRSESISSPDGEQLTVEATANPVLWDDQEAVVLILRESTEGKGEQKAAIRDRDKLEKIVDTLSAAIFLKDTDGRYLLMNNRCREILGIDQSESVVGLTDEELFEEEVATQFCADDRRVFEKRETIEIEETVPTVEGERTMLTRKTPISDGNGEPYALCAVSTDITTQKEREHELRERVKELSAIHWTVNLFESDHRPTADFLAEFVQIIPDSFQNPDCTEARVEYGSVAEMTDNFETTEHSLVATTELEDGPTFRIEVVCTEMTVCGDEQRFLPEEKSLLQTLSTVVAGYIERRTYIDELERLETTLRALGDPVYALDADGRFTFVNDALVERTGYDSEQLLGEHADTILSTEATKKGDRVIRNLITDEERQSAKWELELQTADGERIPVENHVAVLPTDDGEFRGTAGVIRDITERSKREAELRRRQDMLVRTERMADVGGWEYDLESEKLYWTEGTRQIHEVTAEYEPTLSEAIEFYSPMDRDAVREAVERCLESGKPYDIEKRLLTAEGRERWVHIRGELVEENGSRKLRGTIQDITKARESEQQLTVLNRVLRHNLRNNLNVVTANAELLRSQLSALEPMAEIPDDVREQLPGILARNPPDSELDVAELEETIETICSFSVETAIENLERLETNAWELLAIAEKSRKLAGAIDEVDSDEAVDLDSLLSSLVDEYRMLYPDAEITLDGAETRIGGNPAAIRLAVEELLENALKHHDDVPTVTITVAQLTEDRLEVTIADNGPGIPAIEREALEEGEETALKHGSGLGLWTVNWLLSRLGGTVSIDDTESGTTIRLELPAENSGQE